MLVDSIKDNAETLAKGIVSFYNKTVEASSVPGLFPDPYYFWEAGTVLNGLIDYSYLTGDNQFLKLISDGIQFQLGENQAFMPLNQTKSLGNDDQSTWALAAMAAAEADLPQPAKGGWTDYAKNVWETQVARWEAEEGGNGTCGGGLRWQIFSFNAGYAYKDSTSNGNFFLLSARLARFTGNETYSQWASKSYSWAKDVSLISEEGQVFDGTDVNEKCQDFNRLQMTRTAATYIEGAAIMYNLVSFLCYVRQSFD